MMARARSSGLGRRIVVAIAFVVLLLSQAVPAQAHELDGNTDPAHLLNDLLLSFGLPLLVLVIGAIAGVGASMLIGRRQEGGGQSEGQADGEAEPLAKSDQ